MRKIHRQEKTRNVDITHPRSHAQLLAAPLTANKLTYGAATAAQLMVSGNFVTMVLNLRRHGNSRVMYRRPLPRPWLDFSARRLNVLAKGLDATLLRDRDLRRQDD